MESSGICPQTPFSQHMLKLHRAGEQRADAGAWGTSCFEEFSLQSAGVMQVKKKGYVLLQIYVYLLVNVCAS